jgi:addiction module RelE/StbE family toxin
MKIYWLESCEKSLEEIADYIALDNFRAADKLISQIRSMAINLADFPEIGKEGSVAGTREIVVHKNYIMVYRIKKNTVEILYVYHSARNWRND